MIRRYLINLGLLLVGSVFVAATMAAPMAVSAADLPANPVDGAIGIEGKMPSAPPKTGATITTPTNGQTFTNIPITVSGLCPTGLLVKIFSNNVFVGSTICERGSYTILVDLFSGRNDLVARVFDNLDQPGPDSNKVTVTFNDNQFNPFDAQLLSLTSIFAQRGADPGERLTWPVILSGGTGPYAISVDWDDEKSNDLISTEFAGNIDLSHIYDNAGIYKVVVKATDKNGLVAYLQLIAVANGAITTGSEGGDGNGTLKVITQILWIPTLIALPLILLSFWLGRRYELAALRRHLEQQRKD